jgi:acetylornithine aminotransferase
VQTGIGRTGAWFAHATSGVVPDVVTVAKGLGGGIPVGACIGLGKAGELLQPGNHGSTFGGNPVAAAAALAVLRTIEEDGLLEHVTALGATLREGLRHDHVTEVRGEGLLIGLDLDAPRASAVARAALARGFIVNDCTPERIRLAPPLVLTEDQAAEFLELWPAILDDAITAEVTT